MAGLDIYFDALEDCATAVNSVANQFKSLADEGPASAGSCFGALDGKSGKLVQAVNTLEKKINSETRHVQQNLNKVEAALHKVVENIRRIDHPDSGAEQA
ncbi:hypothetical protein ACQPYK_34650 [Streptosporangium sp. CA-135522]|uniref:hypothetical protein n=1 Tax=Streptosporangium sp. CA-135522 TaxID=3240072 RepID=UPI003D8D2A87